MKGKVEEEGRGLVREGGEEGRNGSQGGRRSINTHKHKFYEENKQESEIRNNGMELLREVRQVYSKIGLI